MRRTIVQPADVDAAALADLKSWLGITRPSEDELLLDLLHASLAVCEAFIGLAPFSQLIEERLPVRPGRYTLSSRPIASLASAEIVAQNGIRTALSLADFTFMIGTDSIGTFDLLKAFEGQAIAVRVRVGFAGTWADGPAEIKQGIVRLAAHYYRERDRTGASKEASAPPVSVSALWRPWRLVRLA